MLHPAMPDQTDAALATPGLTTTQSRIEMARTGARYAHDHGPVGRRVDHRTPYP